MASRARQVSRLGDAVRGAADGNGNFVASYVLSNGARLRSVVVSLANANVAAPNAGLVSRVIVYLGEPDTSNHVDAITAAKVLADAANVPGRVIADGDVWAGLVQPAEIPLCGIVEPGGVVTIEVSRGNSGGAAFDVGVAVCLIGDEYGQSGVQAR